MTDDELAMAYADGELDPLDARRFELRMTTEPALAAAVTSHRAVRATLTERFAPIATEPVPARLSAPLQGNVVPFLRARRFVAVATAMAASLVAGVMIGHTRGTAGVGGDALIVGGPLAETLDTAAAGMPGARRVLVSFRADDGHYCRVFATAALDGIACRDGTHWAIRRADAHAPQAANAYRQAGSDAAGVMAAAQAMMAGDPLDPAAERAASSRGWRD